MLKIGRTAGVTSARVIGTRRRSMSRKLGSVVRIWYFRKSVVFWGNTSELPMLYGLEKVEYCGCDLEEYLESQES